MAVIDDKAARVAIKAWIEQQFVELDQKSYYQLLGIDRTVEERAIVSAYYHMVARFHPDNYVDSLDPDTRAKLVSLYSRLVEGYLVLRNPGKREQYARLLEQGKLRWSMAEERGPRRDPEGDVISASGKRFFKLGKASLAAGDAKAALMNLKLALSVEPDNAAILAELAKAEALIGKVGK
jgi:DnaJ-class molecular chaperone